MLIINRKWVTHQIRWANSQSIYIQGTLQILPLEVPTPHRILIRQHLLETGEALDWLGRSSKENRKHQSHKISEWLAEFKSSERIVWRSPRECPCCGRNIITYVPMQWSKLSYSEKGSIRCFQQIWLKEAWAGKWDSVQLAPLHISHPKFKP